MLSLLSVFGNAVEEWLIEPSIFCPFKESLSFLLGGLRFSLDFVPEPVAWEESFSRALFGRTVILHE